MTGSQFKLGVFGSALLLLGNVSVADEVVIYTWEEYISDQVIEQFEQTSGHTIKQIYFENELLRDEVVTTERALAYDLFVINAYTLNLFSSLGLAQNLTDKNLKNVEHINKDALANCGSSGLPYTWGTMGIGYREGQVSQPITSWSDVFTLAKSGTDVVIPDDDIDGIAVALLSLRLPPMSNDEQQLKQAYELLSNHKHDIYDFRTAIGHVLEWREQSTIDAGVVYSGETYTLKEATGQNDWVYTVPQEGTLIWYDCFAAPAKKPLSQATADFLTFMNKPQVAAQNAQDIWFATTNQSAMAYMDEEYLADQELFPAQEVLDKSFFYGNLSSDSLKMRARILSVVTQ